MSTRPTTTVEILAPSSITVQHELEYVSAVPGATPYTAIAHPTAARIFLTINSGIISFNISTRTAIVEVGALAAAAGLIGNQALQGIAFDDTGRYMYATSGVTSLYTFDFGAALINLDAPTLVNTLAISAGGNLHVLNAVSTGGNKRLCILSDSANNFQLINIATPQTPAIVSTTAATTIALGVQIGILDPTSTVIFYPAVGGAAGTGRIGNINIETPASQNVLQLPTISGNQLIADSVHFSGVNVLNVVTQYQNSGTPNLINGFWMSYDVSGGYAATDFVCLTEVVTGGTISVIQAPMFTEYPLLAKSVGATYTGVTDQFDYALFIRDDSAARSGEIRFYRANYWTAGGGSVVNARPPSLVAAAKTSNAWLANPRKDAVGFYCVGLALDRTNTIIMTLSVTLNSLLDQSAFTDISAYVCAEPGIEVSQGIDGVDPTSRMASTGTMTFEVDNSQFNATSTIGKFSPDHASLLASFVVGAQVRYKVNATVMFRGILDTIKVVPGKYRERRVKVSCVDLFNTLREVNTSLLVTRLDARPDEIVNALLDRAPLVPGLANSAQIFPDENYRPRDTFAFAFDRGYDDKTAIVGELQKLLNSVRGYMFMDPANNSITFRNRDEIRNKPMTQIFDDTILGDAEPEHARANVWNVVRGRVYPRIVDTAATTVLFTLGDKPFIKAKASLVIDAPFRDPAGKASRMGGTEMVAPVLTTDFTFFTKKKSGGTNIGSQLSVITVVGGTGERITVHNNGPAGGFLRLMQLRGKGVSTQEPILMTVENSASTAKHQASELVYDMPYEDSGEKGLAVATAILNVYQVPRTFISKIEFMANESDTLYGFLTRQIGDKIGVTETVLGLTNTNKWVLGTSALNTSTHTYPYQTYQIQKINFRIGGRGILNVTYHLLPSDLNF